MNSGSHGEYRQLVGDFSIDAGILDANPGYASRDYQKGEIVFRNGPTDTESGYFMALNDVFSGAKVEDTSDVTSSWIRIADKSGKGFSEAYPEAEGYDHNNLKFNSNGESMAYLKGDVVKVQAHWNDPNSLIFIKALTDVPRKISLNDILLEGIGDGKYFNFIGADRTNGQEGRPTTAYVSPNSNHATPEAMEDDNTALLRNIVSLNAGNYYTPTFAQVGEVGVDGSLPSIYQPTQNWGIRQWNNDIFEYGDVVYDKDAGNDSFIKSISKSVKGIYLGAKHSQGDYVKSNGDWFKAYDKVEAQDKPVADAPDHEKTYPYKAGDNITVSIGNIPNRILVANSNVKGAESRASMLENGDVVTTLDGSGNSGIWYRLENLDSTIVVSNDDDIQAKVNNGTILSDSLVHNLDTDQFIVITNVDLVNGTFDQSADFSILEAKGFAEDITSDFEDPENSSDWTVTPWVKN